MKATASSQQTTPPLRRYSWFDQCIIAVQSGLETCFSPAKAQRANPADALSDSVDDALTDSQRLASARLMRINHAGEVCAQALYRGQALSASDSAVCEAMQEAAQEEEDHLAWCETRLEALGSHTSYLNPLWYAGSFVIGAVAGAVGDKWSLGFVEETEIQVTAHLDKHCQQLARVDKKSVAILDQMKRDEQAHAHAARAAGAQALPAAVKGLMAVSSKVMTHTTYWI